MPDKSKWAALAALFNVSEEDLFYEHSDDFIQSQEEDLDETSKLTENKVYASEQQEFSAEFYPDNYFDSAGFVFDRRLGLGSSRSELRRQIEKELLFYLDEAERLGALPAAVVTIRKKLKPEDFSLMKESMIKKNKNRGGLRTEQNFTVIETQPVNASKAHFWKSKFSTWFSVDC